MDNPHIKERSYRIVHTMRLKNERENRLLREKIYSKQGLRTTFLNELNAVNRQQQRIRRELSLIRKTIATTWGMLPPRDAPPHKPVIAQPPSKVDFYATAKKETKEKRWKRKGRKESTFDGSSMRSTSKDDSDTHRRVEKDSDTSTNERKSEKSEPDSIGLPALKLPRNSDRKETENRSTKDLVPVKEKHDKPTATDQGKEHGNLSSNEDLEEAKGKVMKRLVNANSEQTQELHQPLPSTDQMKGVQVKQHTSGERSRRSNRKPILTPIEEQETEESRDIKQSVHSLPVATVSTAETVAPSTRDKAFSEGDTPPEGGKADTKRRNSEPTQFNALKYNPDGSVRTVHTMPDMESRLKEARKARYIRHKTLMEMERELSISEILGKGRKNKENRKEKDSDQLS